MNRPARLNRTLLAFFGLVLVAAGALPAAIRFGRLPGAGRPLVPGTGLPPTWVLYAVAAAGIVVALAGLRWLAAQPVHRPRSRVWDFGDDGGRTELAAGAAVVPFVEEVRGYPGVHDAKATLAGTRENPVLEAIVSLEQDGDPTAVRRRIHSDGVPRLCQALDLDALPIRIECRISGAAGSRAR